MTPVLSHEYVDAALKNETYTTTWFDMFSSWMGKLVEQWDSPLKAPDQRELPRRPGMFDRRRRHPLNP